MSELNETAMIEGEPAPKKEQRPFAPAEMLACEACSRSNPPNRATCLYCGAELQVAETTEQALPPPGPGVDGGYHLILAPREPGFIPEYLLNEAAVLLNLKPAELNAIVSAGRRLPLACMQTLEQARMLGDRLQALGIDSTTVADAELNLEIPSNRIRALQFSDDGLAGISGGSAARRSARWSDIVLMIAGRLLVNRVEVEERRRSGRMQLMDTRELFTDESVLDLYVKSSEPGWRFVAGNFDFSCLGSTKAMTAFDNFKDLIRLLRERASNAEFDDSYAALRPVLTSVWPIEPQKRKSEWRRSGAGKFDLATVTTTDNELQFTRYSRLCHCLKLRDLENDS